MSVDNPDVRHNSAIGVIDRVENHGACGSLGVALRRGHHLDHALQNFLDSKAGLGRRQQDIGGVAADDARKFGRVFLGLRRRQVDLVEHRDDDEIVLECEVQVGEGLRLDALCRVDQKDRALACGQRSGYLVGEVHVTGGVDHVEDVMLPIIGRERQAHGLALDGDAALALDVHAVQVLGPHLTWVDDPGDLQHAVGQGRLPVVDVRDDAEIPDHRRIGASGLPGRHTGPHGSSTGAREAECRGGLARFGPGASLRVLWAAA